MTEIIYKEDSYAIIGAAIKVFNELGFGYQEKYYCRALKQALLDLEFTVTEQLWTPLKYQDKPIGGYFLDFLVKKPSCEIVLEIKVANGVYHQHIKQVHGYLVSNKIKLGIVIVFSPTGVIYKRIAN